MYKKPGVVSRPYKMAFVMIIVGLLFLSMMVLTVHAQEVTYESNLSEVFQYTPVHYDTRPFEMVYDGVETNETGGKSSTVHGVLTGFGNVSAVVAPEGWDIVFYMVMISMVMLIIIAIELGSLCLYFWLRLHK
jgi:hypothetical protein